MALVLDYLENSCKFFKDKIAFEDEFKSISFYQSKHFAKVVSNEIINKISFCKNEPILIFLPKSTDAIVCMLGAVYSGNFYTPTNVDFPHAKITSLLNELCPKIIITNTKNKQTLLSLYVNENIIICYDELDFTQDINTLKTNHKNAIDTDIVYTYFTSGSTGKPKGVMINHKNITDYTNFACKAFDINEHTIFGNQSSLYFDISTQDIYATLSKSAKMIIIPQKLFAFAREVAKFIQQKNINFLYWVPSAYIHFSNFKALENIDLTCVKSMIFGGEAMPLKHLRYFIQKLPNLKLIANVYGPTEATVNCTYFIVDVNNIDYQDIPLGYAVENKRVLLLDEQNNLITKSNTIGQICILGSGLSCGYYKNEQKTKEVFVKNPLNTTFDEKMYKSGDLGMWDELDRLVFKGRADNQIKHLGYRIELGEIETAVQSLEFIQDCAVLYDELKRCIVLIYVSKSLCDKEIKIKLLKILPKYMVPTKYHKIDTLPLNANGKIDKIQLKNTYIKG